MSSSQRVSTAVGDKTLSLSNLDKVLWPRDGFTKGDLIEYYRSVARVLVPHLKKIPLTLQRYPDGIDGPQFFEKQVPRGAPDWIDRVAVATPGGRQRETTFPICSDEASLVYFANLAAIVFHVWTSHIPTLEEPDYVLFDLDPGERCTLRTLATVALGVRDLLQEIGLQPLVKTTGGFGVHVVVPLTAGYSYESAKIFAEIVARRAASELGERATLQRTIAKRPDDAVYIDFVQVGMGKTIVPPYSVRARDGAPVSTPLHWEEVEAFSRRRGNALPADEFAKNTIRTVPGRLKREGDLWAGTGWKRQRLDKASVAAARRWSLERG